MLFRWNVLPNLKKFFNSLYSTNFQMFFKTVFNYRIISGASLKLNPHWVKKVFLWNNFFLDWKVLCTYIVRTVESSFSQNNYTETEGSFLRVQKLIHSERNFSHSSHTSILYLPQAFSTVRKIIANLFLCVSSARASRGHLCAAALPYTFLSVPKISMRKLDGFLGKLGFFVGF